MNVNLNMNKTEKNSIKKSAQLALCAFLTLFATTLAGAFSLPERVDFYPIAKDGEETPAETNFSESEEEKSLPEKEKEKEPAPDVARGENAVFSPIPVVPINDEKTAKAPIVTSGYETVSVFDVSTGKVAVMPFEEYILGVLLSEMPTSFEDAALMAQAIACRSYTLYKQTFGAHHENGAQLCTSPSHCQAFCPPESVSSARYEKAKAAVDGTRGEVMLFDGAPVLAVFHASSDGKTCSSEEVWGGKLSYLSSVDTAECFNSAMDITKCYTFSPSVFSDKLGVSPSDIYDIKLEKSASGRVACVNVGEKSVSGGDFVRLFGLRSNSFDVAIEAEAVVITCAGYGHGVGMSQYGAQDMAQRGYTCHEILAHYYTGVSFGKIG